MKTKRTTIAAAGMAALLAIACTGAALANPQFSASSSAGQQVAAADAVSASASAAGAAAGTAADTASTSSSDVWVDDAIDLSSDSFSNWSFIEETMPYFSQSTGNGSFLLDASGNVLAGPYPYLSYTDGAGLDYFPFFVVQNEGGLNMEACLDASGTQITDFAYSDFLAVDEHWLCAIAVTQAAEGAEYDYTSSDGNLVVERMDIFHDGAQVASVDRASYGGAQVVDGYLLLQDRDQDVCTVYAPTGEVVNQIATRIWLRGDEYYTDADGVLRFVSGAQVGMADCELTYDDVTNPYLVGTEGNVIYDIYGTAVATLDFQVLDLNPFVGGYAVVYGRTITGDAAYGVLDQDWNLVVPLEYEAVGADYSKTAFTNGYCYVEKDGKFGYLVADGSVAVPLEYSVGAQKYQGDLFCVIQGATGLQVVSAADGLEDAVYSDVYTAYNGTYSPVLQAADANGLWGLVDYHGNVLVDFAFEYSYQVTPNADGTLALVQVGNNAAQIVHIANSLGGTSADSVADGIDEAMGVTPEPAVSEGDAADAGEASDADADADVAGEQVEFGGLAVRVPAGMTGEVSEEGTRLLYINDAESVVVAVYDMRNSGYLAGVTDLAAAFATLAQGSAAAYGASAEDLGMAQLDDGTPCYAYGIEAQDLVGTYVIMQVYVPFGDGFSFLQVGYSAGQATDDEVNALTDVIDSLDVAAPAAEDAGEDAGADTTGGAFGALVGALSRSE